MSSPQQMHRLYIYQSTLVSDVRCHPLFVFLVRLSARNYSNISLHVNYKAIIIKLKL